MVILILGILAGVAAPKLADVGTRTEVGAMLAEKNAILSAVMAYTAKSGQLSGDQMGGTLPPELAPYLDEKVFTVNRPLTGTWDWSLTEFALKASLSLADWTVDLSAWDEVDSEFDDGNRDAGAIRIAAAYGGHFLVFVVDE